MERVASAWRSIGGGPIQRDVVNGPGESPTSDPLRAVTLAVVYPDVVYVRASFGDPWTRWPTQAAADAFLRECGWELRDQT
jgi:hypothetical protein